MYRNFTEEQSRELRLRLNGASDRSRQRAIEWIDEEQRQQKSVSLEGFSGAQVAQEVEEVLRALLERDAQIAALNTRANVERVQRLAHLVQYAAQNEDALSKTIYTTMRTRGFVQLVTQLFERKARTELRLDDHSQLLANEVFVGAIGIIEIASNNGLKLCQKLLKHVPLLRRFKEDLSSEQFRRHAGDKATQSHVGFCVKNYIGILFNLTQFRQLNPAIYQWLQEDIPVATLKEYLKCRSKQTNVKLASLMGHQYLPDADFKLLTNPGSQMIEYMLDALKETAASDTLRAVNGFHMDDLLEHIHWLCSRSERTAHYLVAAGFLKVARDILTDDVIDASYTNKNPSANTDDFASDKFDDYEKAMVVLCLGDICVHRWGCLAVVGVHGLIKALVELSRTGQQDQGTVAGEAQKELDAEPEAPAAPQQPPAKQEGGGGAKQKMVTKEAEEEEAGPETGDEGKQEFERQQMGELAVYSAKCLWMVNRSIIENEEVHMQLHAVKEWQKQLSGDGGSSGHVMISYSWSCKKDFVVRLAEKLKTKQVPVWRDEDQLRFGCNLQNSMFNAVEGAALVVVFYSSFYFRSANCQFEYKNILGLKRPIFPIIFQQPAAQAEKAALTAADQQTQSEYQDWLAGQLHSHSPDEKLYFDASRADPDEKTFDTLVEDIRQQFHEQLKHFKPNASSVPVAQWTAEQVTAWLEKQNLKELKSFNLDGATLAALASDSEGSDQENLFEKLSTKYHINGRIAIRFVSALRHI